MSEIVTLINSVGFPIIACIYLAENNKKLSTLLSNLNITLKGIDTRLENVERELEKHE